MGKIVLLDDLTINQIAAGEVIERPASVVKELVENSIDAGATSISIEVKNGGIKQIKIIDNGSGIAKDDLAFAFERHATSKIRKAEDLETVKSMGFRGEALASIAAISKIELVTKTENEFTGSKVIIEGGNIIEQEETGTQTGTSITINNLFYNTPVRYKFLKKDFTELGYIEDAVTRIALANPNVAIRLLSENKTILKTNGNGDLKTVIYNLYGKETTDGLIDVEYNYEDIKVTGVVGKPEIARSNRSYQMFFVNNRFIKDKTLTAGAEQAFKGLLPIGKFGFLVLNLEMEPKKIDVNVHPTKLEIRFQEEQKVFKAVYHAIREGLLKSDLVKNTEKMEEQTIYNVKDNDETEQKNIALIEKMINPNAKSITEIERTPQDKANIEVQAGNEQITKTEQKDVESIFQARKEFGEENIEIPIKYENNKKPEENRIKENEKKNIQETREIEIPELKEEKQQTGGLFGLFKKKNEEIEKNVEKNAIEEIFKFKNNGEYQPKNEEEKDEKIEEKMNKTEETNVDFEQMYSKTFGIKKEEKTEETEKITGYSFAESAKQENISMFEDSTEYNEVPNYKYCGAVFSTYLIIEMGEEMYIIDQHAAHERVMYEEIKKNYYRNSENDSQIMLLPDIINLSHKEKSIVKENVDLFRKAGFIIEEFGDNAIRLIGVPSICMDLDTKELFLEILDTINTVAITARQEKEDKFIATIACKAAVKAKMALTKEEVDELMKKLLILPNPFTCPHGRPTAIKMEKMDIEKKFNRRK